MPEDHITVYSADEVAQMTAQAAYTSRIAAVLLMVRDELIKSGAAPIILDTIDDIMTDYGLIQPNPDGGEDATPAPA
ncbi:MAG: hypothetical protein PHX39_11915 [Bacteroidales bacterium]|nr:hypothetical protein [Bacteroidales bacterium]